MRRWLSMYVVVHNVKFDLGHADGWVAYEDNKIVGLITYHIANKKMEILSLDSCREHLGIGTALIRRVIKDARKQGCSRITLITTNDNIAAISFYQKRGFDISGFYRFAVDKARKKKPEIPLTGMYGIPLKHEIEFEMVL